MSLARDPLLTELLREVSRSFYLTMRILPSAVRWQISLAYLLARATDTIADTAILPLDRRLAALAHYRDRLLGRSETTLDLGDLASNQSSPSERVLLQRSEDAVHLLRHLTPEDLKLVREVLEIITSGQELDLRRFHGASSDRIIALKNGEELDDYTYRVAGCVGAFWTRICRSHLFPGAKLDDRMLLENGVRFGKGLQLVNILRDLPRDLSQGRCYLPADELAARGLKDAVPESSNEHLARPVFNKWLNVADAHLAAGWVYTNTLPFGQVRVRLACAWPILIGARTLELLRFSPIFASAPVKISRPEVKRLMRKSLMLYPFRKAWRRLGPQPGNDSPDPADGVV